MILTNRVRDSGWDERGIAAKPLEIQQEVFQGEGPALFGGNHNPGAASVAPATILGEQLYENKHEEGTEAGMVRELCKTMIMLVFNCVIEQIAEDTMFHAECSCRIFGEDQSVLFKQPLSHCWQALEVVSYGPGFDPDFDEFSAADQELICLTARR